MTFEEILSTAQKPLISCSFGKDSIVMLHMALKVRKDIDVLYIRQPFYPKKQSFANRVIEELGLNVYQYPASKSFYVQEDDYFDVHDQFYVNGKEFYPVAKGCMKPTGKEFVCIHDLLRLPKINSITFPWDVVFIGQKNCDILHGKTYELPLLNENVEGVKFCYPLNTWTDSDIWKYINLNDVPYNVERYENKNDDYNDDIIPTCNNCLDYRNKGNEVYCPILNKNIMSIAPTKEQAGAFLHGQIEAGHIKEAVYG